MKMKILNLMMVVLFTLVTTISFGQWTYKTVSSAFDGDFKKAYTKIDNNGYLIMEVGNPIIKEDSVTTDTIIGYLLSQKLLKVYDTTLGVRSVLSNSLILSKPNFASGEIIAKTENNVILLEKVNNDYYKVKVVVKKVLNTSEIKRPWLALSGLYFCDDYTTVDFVLVVNGVNKKYNLKATKTSDNKIYYFNESIWSDEFILDFKSASKCIIRVNQSHCDADYYEFNMSGSTSTYNFITK